MVGVSVLTTATGRAASLGRYVHHARMLGSICVHPHQELCHVVYAHCIRPSLIHPELIAKSGSYLTLTVGDRPDVARTLLGEFTSGIGDSEFFESSVVPAECSASNHPIQEVPDSEKDDEEQEHHPDSPYRGESDADAGTAAIPPSSIIPIIGIVNSIISSGKGGQLRGRLR